MSQNQVTIEPPQNGRQLPAQQHSTAVQATAEAEQVRCLFLAAMQCPRNLSHIKEQVVEICQDRELAEEALFSYRRGGSLVEGPSIDLVQEIAGVYGRIKHGWEVLEVNDGSSKVRSYAIDIETLHPVERTFIVEHVGMKGNRLTDARDVYEMVANLAQRRMRSCIEALIPKSIMNAAVRQVKDTLANGSTEPLAKRATELAARFAKAYSVTEAQIEAHIGSKLIGMTESQYVRLIAIAKSLKEGAPIGNFFKAEEAPKMVEPQGETKTAEVKAEPAVDPKKRGGRKPADPKPSAQTAQAEVIQADAPTSDNATPAEPPPLVEPQAQPAPAFETYRGEDGNPDEWSFG